MKRSWFATPYLVWMVLFTIVPLAITIFFAFSADTGGVTLSNFREFFQPTYLKYLWRSLNVAFVCTTLCLLLGYPTALFLADRHVSRSAIVLLLFVLPMWMNFLLRTYAWMSLLESNGLITSTVNRVRAALGLEPVRLLYTYGSMMMGMVYNFLPFMVLPVYSVLSKIDRRLLEAAEDLGANSGQVFRKVILPLSIPGVVSGVMMVFMPSVTTFVISQLLGGGNYELMGDLISMEFTQYNEWHFGSALSIIMMLLILVSMGFLNRFGSEDGGVAW